MLDVEVCDLIKVNVFQADSHFCEKAECELFGKISFAKIIHILTQVAPCLMFGDNVDMFIILEEIKDAYDLVTLLADPLRIDFRDTKSFLPTKIGLDWNNFDADFKPKDFVSSSHNTTRLGSTNLSSK